MIFLSSFFALQDYEINASIIRELNFKLETISGKSFAQALVHTQHLCYKFWMHL